MIRQPAFSANFAPLAALENGAKTAFLMEMEKCAEAWTLARGS